jgi:hypothetical protein
VKVDGTVDVRTDVDKGWVAELAIPFEAARGKEKEMKNVPPKPGTEWRVNFFRLDMPAGRPQAGSAWSPPLVGDFHALDKFGQLVFGDEKGNAPGVAKEEPKKGEEKKGEEKKGEEKKEEGKKAEAPKVPEEKLEAAKKLKLKNPQALRSTQEQ